MCKTNAMKSDHFLKPTEFSFKQVQLLLSGFSFDPRIPRIFRCFLLWNFLHFGENVQRQHELKGGRMHFAKLSRNRCFALIMRLRMQVLPSTVRPSYHNNSKLMMTASLPTAMMQFQSIVSV